MNSTNSEGICLQNDSMAKEYCGLVEEQGDINRRAQLLKLVDYLSEKETSLHLTVFVIISYLASACHCRLNTPESGICVVQAFATLIPWCIDVSLFSPSFMRIKTWQSSVKIFVYISFTCFI